MSFFDRFKGDNTRMPSPPPAERVERSEGDNFAYHLVMERLSAIASETSSHYVRMQTLKDYIEGNQWPTKELLSRVQPVTDNMCSPIVDKYVSFFTRTVPKDRIETRQSFEKLVSQTPKIDEEEVMSGTEEEQHENDLRLELLRTVKYEDNEYASEIEDAAFNSLGLGMGYLRVVGDEASGQVLLTSVNPFHCRIFWKDDNYKEVDGYVNVSMRSVKSIFEKHKIIVAPEKPDITYDVTKTYVEMANFYDAWMNGSEGGRYYLWNISIVGGHVVRNEKYYFDQPISAIIPLPGKVRTNEPWGRSVLEEIVQPTNPSQSIQMQRNRLWSDMMDLSRYAPNNIFLGLGTRLGDKQLPTGSTPVLVEIGRDQRIEPLQLAKPLFDYERLLSRNLAMIDDKTGMPRAAFGDLSNIDLATGIGLTTAFESATSVLQRVVAQWKPALERLNKYIFLWTEHLYPEAKEIIKGNYRTDVKFGKMQPRDMALMSTVLINQKNAQLISGETAMQELDLVESPRQEHIRIANEQNNEWLNPELALQKIQTRAQVEAVKAQVQRQKEMEARPQAGARPEALPGQGGEPGLTPDQNQFGTPQPASQPGEPGAGGPPNQ